MTSTAEALKIEALEPVFRRKWPLVLCSGKQPIGQNWAEHPCDAEAVAKAIQARPDLNVGLILGERSGVVDLECDNEQAAADLVELFGGDPPRTPCYQSKKGKHFLFKVNDELEALATAKFNFGALEVRLGGGGKAAQSLIPPSETDGFARTWITSPEECELAELPVPVVEKLLASRKVRKTSSAGLTCQAKGKPQFVRPGDDFNCRGSWEEILQPHGWNVNGQLEDVTYWTRPGKEGGTSATTGFCKTARKDYLFIFSTNAAPFEADKSYDKFAAYALLNHDGDFSAAAVSLSEKGFGRTLKAETNAGMLVELASDFKYFHAADSEAYVSVPVNGHTENHRVNSKAYKLLLQQLFYANLGKPINSNGLSEAIGVLMGKALFEGPEMTVHVRVARAGGKTYLDLGNDDWNAVEIAADGWKVISNPPVRFRRPKGMLPLPTPERGGAVELLKKFVRVSDDHFKLLVSALVAAFRGAGPYPVIILQGEHGSAKSTTARLCRSLIDPNVSPLRAEPKTGQDLMIAASNSLFLVFDNLTTMKDWLSDALCRLATGGGYSCRELYENCEEQIFDVQRPAMLTGINNPVKRSDLLDRALLIDLPVIDKTDRRPESELWTEFEAVRPQILGALCDGVSAAIRNLPTTTLKSLPRMADFAMWATAAESGFGWPAGSFVAAYELNRETADELALESPVAQAVLSFMADKTEWEGTATELLYNLKHLVDDTTRSRTEWPKTGTALSCQLKELAPNLRTAGLHFDRGRNSKRRRVSLVKVDA